MLSVGLILLMVSLVFLAAPGLDIAVSGLFYDRAAGFVDQRFPILEFIRETGRSIEKLYALALVLPLALKFLLPAMRLLVRPRVTLFGLATFLIGPGLIVNGVLKEHWGRARPRALIEFGGDAIFSPVWLMSDQCARNCSFVSGEGASAFWMVSLAFVVPKPWRPATAIATLAFATAVSFTRIAAGGHFVSDVLIAWLLTLLVMIALQKAILQGLPGGFDEAIEAKVASGGRAVRRLWPMRRDPVLK